MSTANHEARTRKPISHYEDKLTAAVSTRVGGADPIVIRRQALGLYVAQFFVGFVFYHVLLDACKALRGWENDRTINPKHVMELVRAFLIALEVDPDNAIPAILRPEWIEGVVKPTEKFDLTTMGELTKWADAKQEVARLLQCGGNHRYFGAVLAHVVLQMEAHEYREVAARIGQEQTEPEDQVMESADEESQPMDEEGASKKTKKKGKKGGQKKGKVAPKPKIEEIIPISKDAISTMKKVKVTIAQLHTLAKARFKATMDRPEIAQAASKEDKKRLLVREAEYIEGRAQEMGMFVFGLYDQSKCKG